MSPTDTDKYSILKIVLFLDNALDRYCFCWARLWCELPVLLTELLHVDLINIVYLTALLSLSGQEDVALFE